MHKQMTTALLLAGSGLLLTACGQNDEAEPGVGQAKPATAQAAAGPGSIDAKAIWTESMQEKNGVGLDRLDQTRMQLACSNPQDNPGAQGSALSQAAKKSIQYPEDGQYLGDWKKGEKIAQSGKGMQYSDDPDEPNGGNCYACHQLGQGELAYGTVAPSLLNYGARGQDEAVLKYTWGKIWNPQAFLACSHMPRFGDAGILTTDQIRHLMALLLDPESPVNRKP